MTPTQPRTKAGKALLEAVRNLMTDTRLWDKDAALASYRESIVAIEEEAVSEYREALQALFEDEMDDGAWKRAAALLDRSGVTE